MLLHEKVHITRSFYYASKVVINDTLNVEHKETKDKVSHLKIKIGKFVQHTHNVWDVKVVVG
jgi:hypothetical protein